MTTSHIDQLAEWWGNAEQGTARRGDALIGKGHGGHFMIYAADCDEEEPDDAVRILARAQEPKPAWHDAVAVVAGPSDAREVYVLVNDGVWESSEHVLYSDELTGVTPLIVAEVTDEMVKRLENHFLDSASMALPTGLARTMLTAALGLDPA